MQKYKNVQTRAEYLDWKNGKTYAKTDGALYKGLKIAYFLFFLYTFFINLMFCLSYAMQISGGIRTSSDTKFIVIAASVTAILLLGVIFDFGKLNLTACIINIPVIIFSAVMFGILMRPKQTPDLIWGFQPSYLWRHLFPLAIMLIFAVIKLVIAIREKVKSNKSYKNVLHSLYNSFHEEHPDADEADWLKFIENYDGKSAKN